MKLIIFAGGTGKRFWPVSRKDSPKQFLNVAGDKPLLRQRVELLMTGFAPEDIFVSSGKKYEAEIKSMLPELPDQNIILEPEMRDTGPAVAYATAYVNNLFPDEVVAIQWSDHLIKKPESFVSILKEADEIAKQENKVIFITVPARFPSVHRGYIHFGEFKQDLEDGELREFLEFKEKPDVETAQKYIDSKEYGWNPGYWVVPSKFFMERMANLQPELLKTCQDLVDEKPGSQEGFGKLEKISADYMFAEKLKPDEAFVLLSDLGWSDIGEWISFKEALEETPDANVSSGLTYDLNSKDSIIYNLESGKLIATIGLEGMVVVNTPEILAVFPKSDNATLKKLLTELEEKGLAQYL